MPTKIAILYLYANDAAHVTLPQLRTVVFLVLVTMGQCAVYLVRSRGVGFGPAPSRWLAGMSIFAVAAVTLMCVRGILTAKIPASLACMVLAMLLLASALIALAKICAFSLLRRLDHAELADISKVESPKFQ